MNDDPFCRESDPDLHHHTPSVLPDTYPTPKAAGQSKLSASTLSRRMFFTTAGTIGLLPVAAAASTFIPSIQDRQRIKHCQHRFCKNYAGGREYYDGL